jgi:hypothetical protein
MQFKQQRSVEQKTH